MWVTDLQGQSWPAARNRAVFAVGFAYLVAPRVQGFWVLDGHHRIGVTDCSVDAQPLGQTSSS